MLAVSRARTIVDTVILENLMFKAFRRSPVTAACSLKQKNKSLNQVLWLKSESVNNSRQIFQVCLINVRKNLYKY